MKIPKDALDIVAAGKKKDGRPFTQVVHIKGNVLEVADGFILAQHLLPEGHELPDGAVIRIDDWKQVKGSYEDIPAEVVREADPDSVLYIRYPDTTPFIEGFGEPEFEIYLDLYLLQRLIKALSAHRKPGGWDVTQSYARLRFYGATRPVLVEMLHGRRRGVIMPMHNRERGEYDFQGGGEGEACACEDIR